MTLAPSILLGLALATAPMPSLAQLPPSSGDPALPVQNLPTAETIMARVAANQDRAEADRAHYLYIQHAHVLSRKGNTVMCEEMTDSRVTPSPTGYHTDLLKLDGRVLVKHAYVPYNELSPKPPPSQPDSKPDSKPGAGDDGDPLTITIDDNTDRDLVENMRSNLTEGKSKDGINQKLFPLTSKGQADYLFHLAGRERRNGRDVFHIDFRPRDKSDFGWKGDAWIDTAAFEPVVISTAMARRVPLAVRTLLGTNVPGLGFTIVYAPQPDGVWFPVSLGTEFRIHVLFFFSRQIVIDAQNRSFEKTHVTSEMLPGSAAVLPQ